MNANGFSLEIALKPAKYHKNGFKFLFVIHNGDDGKQLVVGQYRSSIIVMNGDDYDHKRRTKRIAVKLAENLSIPQFVTITTGKDGARIFLDGRLIQTQRDLTLKIPEGEDARFLLGNSVYGRHNWQGDVLGLAVYRHPLSEQDVEKHFKHWFTDGNFLFEKKYQPDMLYVFDEIKGKRVMDHAGGNIDFHIPSKMTILNKKILSLSRIPLTFSIEFFEDVMINLIGFIPFGFFLNAMFAKVGNGFEKHGILITVILCFVISLFIEVFQAWIPSRSSDVLDLALNTMGGVLGASASRSMEHRVKSIGLRG